MKAIVAVVCALLIAYVAEAQAIKSYGVKIGYTSANQTFDYTLFDFETRRQSGINGAVYIEWLDLPWFSVVTQLEYSQRGMATESVITGDDPTPIRVETLHNRLSYISVPLLAKGNLSLAGMSVYCLAGPRVDFLVEYKSDRGLFNAVYDQFKQPALGGTVGVGAQFERVLPLDLLVEARYNFDVSNSYQTELLRVRNYTLDIWLGVAF